MMICRQGGWCTGGAKGQGRQVSTGDAGWRFVLLEKRVPGEIKIFACVVGLQGGLVQGSEDPLTVKSDRPCIDTYDFQPTFYSPIEFFSLAVDGAPICTELD